MNKQFLKDALFWGFILWLIGYGLGMVLFSLVPASYIGWIIMPIGTALTIWVVLKKVKGPTLQYYLSLAVVWTAIAVVFDYFFLVRAFRPADGYYKFDVYLYYTLTFLIPLAVGWIKNRAPEKPGQILEVKKTEDLETVPTPAGEEKEQKHE